jgi:hypothetical protein
VRKRSPQSVLPSARDVRASRRRHRLLLLCTSLMCQGVFGEITWPGVFLHPCRASRDPSFGGFCLERGTHPCRATGVAQRVSVCVGDSQVVSSLVAATRAAVTACLFLSALVCPCLSPHGHALVSARECCSPAGGREWHGGRSNDHDDDSNDHDDNPHDPSRSRHRPHRPSVAPQSAHGLSSALPDSCACLIFLDACCLRAGAS